MTAHDDFKQSGLARQHSGHKPAWCSSAPEYRAVVRGIAAGAAFQLCSVLISHLVTFSPQGRRSQMGRGTLSGIAWLK